MSTHPRHGLRAVLLATSLAIGLAATSARAADVTPAQAEDVARQLHTWLAATLGPNVKLPPEIVRVSADGAQYRLALPLPFPVLRMQDAAGATTEALFTAMIHPLDGSRWAIDDLRVPALIGLTPDAAASLAGLTPPAAGASPANAPPAPSAELRIGAYSGTGTLDTALNSESRIESNMQGISFHSAGLGAPGNASRLTIDRATNMLLLRPNTAGGTDIVQNATIEGYASTSQDGGNGEVRVNARRVSLKGEIGALMLPQIGALLRTLIQLGMDNAHPAPAAPPASTTTTPSNGPNSSSSTEKQAGAPRREASPVPPPVVAAGTLAAPIDDATRAGLRSLLAALKSIVTGMAVEETVEGLAIEAQGQRGSAERARFALGGSAPAGKLRAHIELGVDGLAIPGLPPQFAELVPRGFALRPTVSNIDVTALTAIAEAATAPDADADMLTAQLMGLLAQGGVDLGIERLTLEMGPARLAGTAAITVTGPMTAKGTGEITMTGYDALMDKVQKMPEAAQAIPVLALLRGLARPDHEKLVWHLVLAEDMKMTVNGVDITKLAGGK